MHFHAPLRLCVSRIAHSMTRLRREAPLAYAVHGRCVSSVVSCGCEVLRFRGSLPSSRSSFSSILVSCSYSHLKDVDPLAEMPFLFLMWASFSWRCRRVVCFVLLLFAVLGVLKNRLTCRSRWHIFGII